MQRALVLALPGLGDSIMAIDAMHMLRAHTQRLDAFCMQRITHEFLLSCGLFDEVVYAPLLEMRLPEALRTIAQLRKRRYDVSLTVYPSYRWQYHVVSALLGAKRRVIDAGGMRLSRILNPHAVQTPESHNAERNRVLAQHATGAGIAPSRPVAPGGNAQGPVVLHVGSMKYKGNENKRWPAQRFVELGRLLFSRGCRLTIVAGPHDVEDSLTVVNALKPNASLILTKNFQELVSVIDDAAVVVGNDAGVVHVAAYRGVPTIVLYGMTDPERVKPIGPDVTVVRPSDCAPCFHPRDSQFVCKRNIDFRCLSDLTVSHAYTAIRDALGRNGLRYAKRH